jgi:hypothetical protein
MRLIIAGSRTFENMLTIEDVDIALKKFKLKPTEIISGECKGPDMMGHAWGDSNGVPVKEYPAKWNDITNCKNPKKNKWGKLYNPMAGFERNTEMAKNADAVLVFWDEESHGTEQMIAEANKIGIPVYYAKPNPEYIVE